MSNRHHHPMTDSERKSIISGRKAGKSYKELAKMTGRPLGTISSVLSMAIWEGKTDRVKVLDPCVQRKSR